MALTLVAAPDLESCCQELAASLDQSARAKELDAFACVPILVGSSGLDGWVRSWLAHYRGVAAGLQICAAQDALAAAVEAMLSAPGDRPETWWRTADRSTDQSDPWTMPSIAARLLAGWTDPAPQLHAVRAHLDSGPAGTRDARGMALATSVAEWTQGAMWRSPRRLLGWAAKGHTKTTDASDAVWLQYSVAQLLAAGDSPADRLCAVLDGKGQRLVGPPLRILGLTATDQTTRDLLARIAAHHPVEWYRPTSSPKRWLDPDAPKLTAGSVAARLLASEEDERQAVLRLPSINCRVSAETQHQPTPVLAAWQAALRDTAADGIDFPTTRLPQLMPAWGPRREVEAVRDRLLEAFRTGDLEPRDVLILTPDLSTYAPLVATLFGQSGGDAQWSPWDWPDDVAAPPLAGIATRKPPAIPVRLAGLGLTQTNPVAAALLLVLELSADRVTAPAVHALASLPPVQSRFGLTSDSLADLRALLLDSGARWGLDGHDKAQIYGVDAHRNSLAFGLERMALGALLHDEDQTSISHGRTAGSVPLTPLPTASGDRLSLVGALGALLRSLASTRDALRSERTDPQTWREHLAQVLSRFTATGSATAWLSRAVLAELDDTLVGSEDTSLDLEAVRRTLRARFELPVPARSAFGSVVSVQPLRPQTITPRPVVILLGMGTGSFPQRHRPPEWAPVDDGEHDPVDLQRQAFAEAVLAAGRDLWITWPARELAKGQELPPCTPVAELLEVLTGGDVPPKAWLEPRGRHAWSPCAGAPGAPTFAADQATASAQLAPGATPRMRPWSISPPGSDPIPASSGMAATDDTTRDVSGFAQDLLNPSKAFLYGRLDVYLDELETPLPEREPLELDSLEKWSLKSRLLSELRSHEPEQLERQRDVIVKSVLDETAGAGTLPLEAGAEQELDAALDEVIAIAWAHRGVHGERALHDVPVQASVATNDGVLDLLGTVPEVLERGAGSDGVQLHHWTSASDPDSAGRFLLGAWIALNLARAQGQPVQAARLVGKKGACIWLAPSAPPSDGASATEAAWLQDVGQVEAIHNLERMATLWWQSRQAPLQLFKSSSFGLTKAWLSSMKKPADRPSKCASAFRNAWITTRYNHGDDSDRWIAALHPGLDPSRLIAGSPDLDRTLAECAGSTSLVALARLLWQPVLDARRTEKTGAFNKASPLLPWKATP